MQKQTVSIKDKNTTFVLEVIFLSMADIFTRHNKKLQMCSNDHPTSGPLAQK